MEIIVSEGKNHQLKHMLGAMGFPVHKLHRDAIGGLCLYVPEGSWRELRREEMLTALGYSEALKGWCTRAPVLRAHTPIEVLSPHGDSRE